MSEPRVDERAILAVLREHGSYRVIGPPSKPTAYECSGCDVQTEPDLAAIREHQAELIAATGYRPEYWLELDRPTP